MFCWPLCASACLGWGPPTSPSLTSTKPRPHTARTVCVHIYKCTSSWHARCWAQHFGLPCTNLLHLPSHCPNPASHPHVCAVIFSFIYIYISSYTYIRCFSFMYYTLPFDMHCPCQSPAACVLPHSWTWEPLVIQTEIEIETHWHLQRPSLIGPARQTHQLSPQGRKATTLSWPHCVFAVG